MWWGFLGLLELREHRGTRAIKPSNCLGVCQALNTAGSQVSKQVVYSAATRERRAKQQCVSADRPHLVDKAGLLSPQRPR